MTNEAQTICVVDQTIVAGTRHIPDMATRAQAYVQGDRFSLKHDARNRFDPWAVEVYDPSHERVGYVSCECNEFIARLLDGGKSVDARLQEVSTLGSWTRLVVEVHLND
jgi:hypothetical protein